MESTYTELALTALAAMLSPTTLSFSVLALVMGDRPKRTGLWFYLGALTATLAIGVLAAFVIGDAAANSSKTSQPKTWVCIVDIVAGVLVLAWIYGKMRQPPDRARMEGMLDQMSKVASSPWIAIVAAGATLANPGGFIPLALKQISQVNPSTGEYLALWAGFTLISLLPLGVALLLLVFVPERAQRILGAARYWLERHARTIAAVILVLLAAALLRNGIDGLT